ncbi:unnamed protein product [Rotaria magnacalcarata]|uniref:Uncharacterized protein n=1 Tax=Rotaria magnacalcarata TaxID=392030 RepID=A0A817A5E1_9BILA|nr:unnamed protein product [Rotaria magnacalcarata]CAF1424819.1 unnamed protein product [Rotaria magnacalcarata]CAF2063240.1 unnamed protein product [Rotaria magnacalcarata]CAF2155161.1 unnamed protein product [Rotaria magnacalcarata]CAF2245256.1 unnamed protein product [Rotaria magnacalcarata]
MAAPHCHVGPPKHVYSATVKNSSNDDVEIEIEYAGSQPAHHETIKAHIPQHGSHEIHEKTVQTDGYEQRKFLQKITVHHANGNKQVLESPFHGVISPEKNWKFEIGHDSVLKSGTA